MYFEDNEEQQCDLEVKMVQDNISHPQSAKQSPKSSAPKKWTPTLKGSAKFRRIGSSGSEEKYHIGFDKHLKDRVLITQLSHDGETEDDSFSEMGYDWRGSRMSRDTDYETDLEMDYDQWIADEEGVITEESPAEKKYTEMCNKTGVIPVSYFLKHINEHSFRMKYHGLGPLGSKAICTLLKDNLTIEILDLEGNSVEADGAYYIANMLRENIYITDLNLAENEIGKAGAEEMANMLYKNDTLRVVNLSGNNLEDCGAEKICNMLKKNTALKKLYLSHNMFEEKGAMFFKEALSQNENLDTLDLSWNHFRTNGAVAIAKGVQENYGLKRLNLSMNGLAQDGAEAIGKALKHNRTLVELDISYNRIKDDGCAHISLGLQTNDSLQILKIGSNPLGTDGTLALLVSIAKNDTSAIVTLDLDDVYVSKDFKDAEEELEKERMFSAYHAGVLRENDTYETLSKNPLEVFKRDPFGKVKQYAKEAGYRLVDVFRDMDKDGNNVLSSDEFISGIKNAGIKITLREIDVLLNRLDLNKDGLIDYGELLMGDKEYKKKKKKMLECPDQLLVQQGSNRISKIQSDLVQQIIEDATD